MPHCAVRQYVKRIFEDIKSKSIEYLDEVLSYAKTFKVTAKRADKSFPMKSPEICRELGGVLLEKFPHLTVNVNDPEITVTIEIRDTKAYIHAENIKGAGDCLWVPADRQCSCFQAGLTVR